MDTICTIAVYQMWPYGGDANTFKDLSSHLFPKTQNYSVADPEFSGGGSANLLFCQIFSKNCMKMKQFGLGGRDASLAKPVANLD